jgi:protein SCO1/2
MSVVRTLLVSGILLVAGGAVLAAVTDRFQAFTTETARRVEVQAHPPWVPAAALETQSGTRLNLADLRGKWLVVDFIYTRCMTYCSVLGGEFAQLQDQLATPLTLGKVQLLSISFDPAHDTPGQLADYLKRFRNRGQGWLATRPLDANGLRRLKQVFGITVIPDELGGFVHNAAIQIVDPQGRLVEILDMGDPRRVGQTVLRDINR